MSERTKNWIKSNILELIIAAMLAAFWADYQADKANDYDWRRDITYNVRQHDDRIRVLMMSIIANPHTDDYTRSIMIDYLKADQRGGQTN